MDSHFIQPDPAWEIGKHALLNVFAECRDGRTILEPRSWRIPFQWQGYHYQDHDDQPYLPLVNSGGGFVEGDVSQFQARLAPRTRTLITTTSSSKFYKCPGGGLSRELVGVEVGADALLEYYPDEAIPYAQSRVERVTRIGLDRRSRLFATDMLSAGRVHYGAGEAFQFDSLRSSFEIRIDGRLAALDRLKADTPEAIAALPRLWAGALHMATVFAYAPDLPPGAEAAVQALAGSLQGTRLGASRVGPLVIARILSTETWQAHEALHRCWTALRPLIAGKPARRIRKC